MDILPNDTFISAAIPIVNDGFVESLEVFSVSMSSPSELVLVEENIAIVQIVDEDGT